MPGSPKAKSCKLESGEPNSNPRVVFGNSVCVSVCVCVCVCVCVRVRVCSVAQLCATLYDPWTVAHKAPMSMEFSRQEYWSRLPFLTPGLFPTQGSNPHLLYWQVAS